MGTAALPRLPYFDPGLRGPRFHALMREIAAESWIAESDLARFVLDREAAEFFLRSRACTFPAQFVAELYGVSDGPLREEIDRNILHIDGPEHARLRGKVNHAFTPKAADGWRPTMRELIARTFAAVADDRCEAVAELCKPYPAPTTEAIVSAGYGLHSSATASHRVPSIAANVRPISSRIVGRQASAAFGVNALLTLPRSRACSGPSMWRMLRSISSRSGPSLTP